MVEKRIFVRCEDHDIPMVIDYPDGDGPFPCILLLHGFMSWKESDGYLFTKTAKALAEGGIASARIDFCSMGENRYSREHYGTEICVKEAKTSFAYLQTDPMIVSDRIGICGHSMGGRITFLCAGLPSKCLISFNGAVEVTVPKVIKLKFVDYDELAKNGYSIIHTSDGRVELLFKKFLDDSSICCDDILSYTNPVLLCVGAADPTVDPNTSYDFYHNSGLKNIDMIVIEGANHTFNAKTGDYTKVYELLDKFVPWVQAHI